MSESGAAALRSAGAEGRARPQAARDCGDLLRVFCGSPASAPVRVPGSAGWETSGGLSLTAPGGGWRGYPLRTLGTPPWRLWLVGELAPTSGGDADALLCDVARGRAPARNLNGHFLLVGHCASDDRWHVWTDRFGTVHAYYGSGPRGAALSTCFASVAGVASARRLDWPALAHFFACGFFPADRSFFDDVRLIRPATHAVFSESGERLSEERYAGWTHAPDRSRSYADTVAEFGETLHRVLDDETASGRIAVPISGGLDSRTTLAAVTRPGAPARDRLWSYSYGYTEDSIETRIARRVAQARRVPLSTQTVGPYLFERLPSVLACVEGFQDVTQARQAAAVDLLSEKSDAVIAAHWGDVWLDDMGLAGERPDAHAVSAYAFRKVAKRGRDWLLAELAGPRLAGEDPERLARGFVESELARVADVEEPDFRVKAFKTEQWSFRWTLASLRMYQAAVFPRLPFYDTRMAEFFATVPTEWVAGRQLQIDYLKRYAPDLARITWQAYGTNLYWRRHFDTWLLPWRAARKAARALRRGPDAPARNWEVQFGGAGFESLRSRLLGPGARLHAFVAPPRIEELLAQFAAAPLERGRGYTVSMLLTFAAWLEAHG